jgi:hypothetical protein
MLRKLLLQHRQSQSQLPLEKLRLDQAAGPSPSRLEYARNRLRQTPSARARHYPHE